MNTRIKQIRKTLDLTQFEFAKRLGTVQNTITGYESGRRNPSNAVITSICREFNVNEEWLRTGNGSMFIEHATFNLDEYAKQHGASDDEIELLKLYFDMDPKLRREFIDHFKNRFGVPNNPDELEAKYGFNDKDDVENNAV